MANGILTLFGEEELQPEDINAVGKSRAVPKEKKEPEVKETKKAAPPPPAPEAEKPKATPKPKAKKPIKPQPKEDLGKTEILAGWVAEKQYYSIGEVATLFKVATSHIRFWTKEFDMRVRTTRKGDRLYAPDQIKELRAIYNLVKERGYTIAGAKAKLKSDKKASVETIDLKQSMLQLRNKLLHIRNQLG
ncbi:MAG: MerR family transcriptional regulator [Sphingobacteriales bacterium]|nr:MAG: MerR family transcriptional regulator [Sphingobacteriales bacterium]